MPIRCPIAPLRWLWVVAIAAGLIGMHQLTGPFATHQHLAVGEAMGTGHLHATAAITPSGVATGANARNPAGALGAFGGHGGCPGTCATMAHPCQAILTTAASLGAAPLAATVPSAPAPAAGSGQHASTLAARGPPALQARLSQLGVWRR